MKYEIQVHDIQFTMIDEDGNELPNKDGSPKLFTLNPKCDVSWIDDSVQADWLEEWEYDIVPKRKGYSMQETMEFVRDHFLQWELIGHHTDHDAYLEFHNYRNATHFCKYPYANESSLIEGIQFIMDMHYRNKAEGEAHASL
jgi:hypothetical protein